MAVIALTGPELDELSRHPAPGGDRELVLYRGYSLIDPTWELRLRSGSGLTAREWDLGCLNSDLVILTGVEWTGRDALRFHLSCGQADIVLDGATGSPDRQVSVGC